jgi:hypothetical protein
MQRAQGVGATNDRRIVDVLRASAVTIRRARLGSSTTASQTSIRSRSSGNASNVLRSCGSCGSSKSRRRDCTGFVVATHSPCATRCKSTFRVSIRRSAVGIASVPRKSCRGTRFYALHIHLHAIHTACREYGNRGRMHIMVSCVTMGAMYKYGPQLTCIVSHPIKQNQ